MVVELAASMRILLVEDDRVLLRTLTIGLRAEGHEVLVAADGRTALPPSREDQPELVILDLGLPDLPGMDVLTSLRAWSKLPVIVLSARVGLLGQGGRARRRCRRLRDQAVRHGGAARPDPRRPPPEAGADMTRSSAGDLVVDVARGA